jgi:hypothetical protein
MDRDTTRVASKLIHQRQQLKNQKRHVSNLRKIHNLNTRSTNFEKHNLKTYNVFYHVFSKEQPIDMVAETPNENDQPQLPDEQGEQEVVADNERSK